MAKYYLSPLLFLTIHTLTTTTATMAASTTSTPPPPTTTLPEELRLQRIEQQQQQLNNILNALIGAGDFKSWIDVLSLTDSSLLPLSATFFVPTDTNIPTTTTGNDPLLILYHIVPQRLSFKDLCVFRALSLLPTLLPSKYILVTNNSASNYTLDNALLSHPNLLTTTNIAVHGISSLLNYSFYGDPQRDRLIQTPPLSPPLPPPPRPTQPPPPPLVLMLPKGELVDGHRYHHHHHEGKTSSSFVLPCGEDWSLRLVFLILFGFLLLGSC